MTLALLAALAASLAQGEELRSPSGCFAARVELAGGGAGAVLTESGETGTREVARSRHACREGARHALADEGPTLVHVDPEARADAPAVLLLRAGGEPVAFGPDALGLGEARPWIELGSDSVRLERAEGVETLDLLARDGRIVAVDLAARRASIEPAANGGQPTVEPSALPEGGSLARLIDWIAPAVVAADEELVLDVGFELHDTRTEFAGFQLVVDRAAGVTNVLPLVRSRAFVPGERYAILRRPTRVPARVRGLPPGVHRLRVDGSQGVESVLPVREVRVLPAGARVELVRSGGFAGIRRTIRLDERARLAVEGGGRSRLALVARARCEPIRAGLARLPDPPPERASRGGADLLRSEFLWRGSSGWRSAVYDDTTIPPEFVALATALEELASPAPR